jgi:hypothetical protein
LLGGVDGEVGEEFAVVVDDSYVLVGDQQQDPGAGQAPSDSEVEQFGAVAQGDLAGFVDAVTAHPVMARNGDTRSSWLGLGASGEGFGGGAPGEGPVGSDLVVVVGEAVELGL